MKRRFGFTLIELVMVIIILGILAAVTLPKFLNFKTLAIEKSEDAIAGALNAAIKIYNTSYIVAGGDPTSYPFINPFTFLEQAPPYTGVPGLTLAPDGVNWVYYEVASYAFYIYCPHRDGVRNSPASGTKGRFYIYQNGVYGAFGHQPGDFWLINDKGH